MAKIGRLITAMVTPFNSRGEVDYKQAQKLAKALIASGSDGLVVTGTTGERPTMTDDEQLKLWESLPPDIVALAGGMLHNPATVSVTPTASTAEKVSQWVLHVQSNNKRNLLSEVLRDRAMARVLVFTRTKHGANRVAEYLNRGRVCTAEAIHGNKSQSARERALAGFKKGSVRVLVATDIASRGIDVDGITHVINFELPNEPESYVHRIGRTGRAGAAGIALSFCDPSERTFLRDIERLTRARLRVVESHPYSGQPRALGAIA